MHMNMIAIRHQKEIIYGLVDRGFARDGGGKGAKHTGASILRRIQFESMEKRRSSIGCGEHHRLKRMTMAMNGDRHETIIGGIRRIRVIRGIR